MASSRFSIASALFALALCVDVTRAQTDADAIAGLCRSDTDSMPADYINTAFAPSITLAETQPLALTLTTSQSGATAFWLLDDDGERIAFTSDAANGAVTFDISSRQPHTVTAFVHYGEPLCRVASSGMVYTYDGEIDRYLRKTDNYGDSWWPAQLEAASRPIVTVDYAAKSATVEISLFVDKPVPFVYVRGASGQLLAFGRPSSPISSNTTYRLTAWPLPEYGTAVFGCAPLGGEIICTEFDLTPIIVAHCKAAHAKVDTSITPIARLASESSLSLAPPADDAACAAAADSYVSWVERLPAGTVAAFAQARPLSLPVGSAAQCDYRGSECIVNYYLLCGDTLRYASVNVSALAPTEPRRPSGELTGSADGVARLCEADHPGKDTSWLDEATGERCECFNGVAECGPPPSVLENAFVITSLEAALIAGAGAVIAIVLGIWCVYLRMRHMRAMETPIEGAKRRSLVLPSKNDYVKSKTRGYPGSEEVELPAPPMASGSNIHVARDSHDEAEEDTVGGDEAGAPPQEGRV